MDALPSEIWLTIARACDPVAIYCLTYTNSQFRSLTLPIVGREHLPERAASQGHLDILKWLKTRGSKCLNALICIAAAEGGHLETLMWLRSVKCDWNYQTTAYAALNGHLELLKWAKANGCVTNKYVCSCAAAGGQLEVLKWARDRQGGNCKWDIWTTGYAAKKNHFEVLKWARENGCRWNWKICAYAARRGNLEMLQWARANGCNWNKHTCMSAAKIGRIDIIEWARANGCEWDTNACKAAAKKGNVQTLKWLVDNGCPLNTNACIETAVSRGHIGVIKWLVDTQKGIRLNARTMRAAAYHGRIDVIELLVDNGCEFNKSAFEEAISSNMMDVMNWAHDRGYRFSELTYQRSWLVQIGHLVKLKWLMDRQYLSEETAMKLAISGGYIDVLEYLYSKGCPLPKDICAEAGSDGSTNILKWLVSKGLKIDTRSYMGAFKERSISVLQWASKNDPRWEDWTNSLMPYVEYEWCSYKVIHKETLTQEDIDRIKKI